MLVVKPFTDLPRVLSQPQAIVQTELKYFIYLSNLRCLFDYLVILVFCQSMQGRADINIRAFRLAPWLSLESFMHPQILRRVLPDGLLDHTVN